jgi:Mg/Co/Ni transporter MgtE
MVKYDLLALPVVDEINHLLGMVTVDDVLTYLVENPRSRKYVKKHSYLALMQNWAQG